MNVCVWAFLSAKKFMFPVELPTAEACEKFAAAIAAWRAACCIFFCYASHE